MKSMRITLLFIFVLMSIFSFAQDKVYLNDNTLLEGIITKDNDSKIELALKDKSHKTIDKKDIALIIYESGYSEVVSHSEASLKENKEIFKLSDWTIGTNILLPLDYKLGFTIEKNISEFYSIRVGESFKWNNYRGFEFNTSFLNNFYFGKGRIKWLNSFGLNLNYSENNFNYILYDFAYPDLIWPGPPAGFHSGFEIDFTMGTGVNIDITKRIAFSTQLFISCNLNQDNSNIDLDFYNSGFYFFYKF